MWWRRVTIGALAAGATAAGLFLGGVLGDDGAARSGAPVTRDAAEAASVAADGFAAATDTAAQVARLQAAVQADPGDVKSLGLLGLAYQQRARETGDPAWYTKSDGVLHEALRLAPDDLVATSGLGSLALARHRFADALSLGERASRLAPAVARTYGVIGDALLELGRYDEAFAAFDRLASLKPGVAAYARVSYARELRGDVAGAIEAMELAVDAATGAPEPMAWTRVQLGKLHWSRGDIAGAEAAYREALDVLPGYVYALGALAEVEHARGDDAQAISLAEQAVAGVPLPQFVSLLGDLYAAAGREEDARRQDELMGAIDQLLAANGVATDLESAVWRADRGLDPQATVELARRARAERPSIDGDDALAWALVRAGRCDEALGWSEQALRLGTQDALKLFHRGMVDRCRGDEPAARGWFERALALNPSFSVRWAPVARAAMEGIA